MARSAASSALRSSASAATSALAFIGLPAPRPVSDALLHHFGEDAAERARVGHVARFGEVRLSEQELGVQLEAWIVLARLEDAAELAEHDVRRIELQDALGLRRFLTQLFEHALEPRAQVALFAHQARRGVGEPAR